MITGYIYIYIYMYICYRPAYSFTISNLFIPNSLNLFPEMSSRIFYEGFSNAFANNVLLVPTRPDVLHSGKPLGYAAYSQPLHQILTNLVSASFDYDKQKDSNCSCGQTAGILTYSRHMLKVITRQIATLTISTGIEMSDRRQDRFLL